MSALIETKQDRFFDVITAILLIILCAIVLYPLILVVSSSFSDPVDVMANRVVLLPVHLNLSSYKMVLHHPEIGKSYFNTIVYTVVGVLINLIFTTLGAYPLSRRDFYGRGVFTAIFTFTMFFGGGMIPSYILVKELGLLDTIWALVLPKFHTHGTTGVRFHRRC